MKITIYELLGMIKDGKAPKKVKYDNINFEYDGIYYMAEHTYLDEYCDLSRVLNDEVEIIEEEKKIKPLTKKDIEALGYACGEIQKCFTNGWTKSLETKPLEEEHKIPEKLKLPDKFEIGGCNVRIGSLGFVPTKSIVIDVILSKMNDIIDYLEEVNK